MSFDFPMVCLLCALTSEACAFILYLRMQMPRFNELGRTALRPCRIQIMAGFACCVLLGSTFLFFYQWRHGDDDFTALAMNVGFTTVCERLGAESNECALAFRRCPDGIVLSGSRNGPQDGSVSILVTKDPLGVYAIKE